MIIYCSKAIVTEVKQINFKESLKIYKLLEKKGPAFFYYIVRSDCIHFL